jgi:hypothetical protein
MKAKLAPKIKKSGGALIIALTICAIASLSMAGYLLLVEQQNMLSARSQSWNVSMAVVEAGIEEALEHLNVNAGNLSADGWSFDGTFYNRTRTLPDGNSYSVSVSVTNTHSPVILSEARVKPFLITQNGLSGFFAQIGFSQPSSTPTVSRAVKVGAYKGGLFLASMVAKKGIDLNGNGIATDSFDSSDPRYSTNGQYDPSKVKDNGDVATNEGIVNSAIDVGNANIYGHAHTGPGGGVVLGPNGAIGSHAWQASNSGVEPGWFLQDSNFTFPDTTAPYTSGLTPTSGNLVVTSLNITSNSITASTPPANTPWGGVSTNITSVNTVTSYPNPVPTGLTTNTTMVTSANYPSPAPSGLVTNTTTVNTSSLPSPIPAGTTTNTIMVNGSSTLPSPIPSGTTTNIVTTFTTDKNYPADGTYYGTPVKSNGKWDYNLITGYTYNYPTTSYSYPTYTYTYPTYTYNIPTYSYTYNQYTTNTVITTNYYDYILNTGDYYATSLSGKTMVLGTARLVLPNGLNMGSTDTFTIGQNGSICVYSGGTSCTVYGNGVINQPGYAANFILYCANSVTSFALNGNAGITGVVIAPNVDLRMNGGGNNIIDFIGCLMVNSATMNGHYHFHYDEALNKILGNGRYLITSWDEVSPTH